MIYIWRNGLKKENSFYIQFDLSKCDINKLHHFKHLINDYIRGEDANKDKLRLFDLKLNVYSYKGYELSNEEDISNLKNKDIVFLCLNGIIIR